MTSKLNLIDCFFNLTTLSCLLREFCVNGQIEELIPNCKSRFYRYCKVFAIVNQINQDFTFEFYRFDL
jgi:hypothetical protein